MAILTVAQFKLVFDTERIEHLASVYNSVDELETYSEPVVQAILDQSEGEILNALSKSYSTTQIEADKSVKRLTAIFAMYYLQMRRGSYTDDIEKAYERAVILLENLEEGEVKLAAVAQLLPLHGISAPVDSAFDDSDLFDGLNPDVTTASS